MPEYKISEYQDGYCNGWDDGTKERQGQILELIDEEIKIHVKKCCYEVVDYLRKLKQKITGE